MEQGQPVADALPGLTGPTAILTEALNKTYAWKGWDQPLYNLRIKDSYAVLHEALLSLPRIPAPGGQKPEMKAAQKPHKAQKPPKY